ncbi:hypothetical protein EYF80_051682 [Xyrichtys novacula]|uniref:G-protein coupled receptors family 1 profile domain-containing protein n=1 Tax=Xyrichtys novacula TaxID=13765 RepID=A0AAV1EHS3_XYRNO|nr:hypothetical protein EYF80_051682 [Xyrichtys novacula]
MYANTSDLPIHCHDSSPGIFIFMAFTVTSITFLPLHMLVLFIGYQQWRQRRAVSTETVTNHSDVFTFYIVGLQFMAVFGCCLYSGGALAENETLISVGTDLIGVTSSGQVLFHLLTCAERYLAVIYPITYHKLRQRGGVRIRNISIGCVWILCSGFLFSMICKQRSVTSITAGCVLVFALVVVCFCSFSVLRALVRPGPGDGGRDRAQVDQTKKKAFYTITTILGTLLLRFVTTLVTGMVFSSEPTHAKCAVGSSMIWFTLPSNLVLPLLFLHRAGLQRQTANMSMNSSSATNSSDSLEVYYCTVVNFYIIIGFRVVRALLTIPICVFVLYLGHRRWRQQRSSKSISHSDVFTYHQIAMEFLCLLGFFFYLYGNFAEIRLIVALSYLFSSVVYYGGTLFHVLTCVERYLAVVHPVTYLGLKNERGVCLRNISIGFVWLLSFVLWGVGLESEYGFPIAPVLSTASFALIIICFCNISILCVLVRPKPGEGAGVEQTKLRAFQTITAIMGVLCFWFVGFLVSVSLRRTGVLIRSVRCVVIATLSCYNVPSSLVLPLLYLHRAGKLPCCSYNNSKT